MTPGTPRNIVRIPIDKAKAAGKYDQYKAVALEETATHLRVEESAWRAIKGQDTSGVIPAVARRVAHGAAGLVKSMVGADPAPPEVVASRLAVCAACEHSHPADKPVEKRRCGKLVDVLKPGSPTCGCNVVRKTKLRSESCPLGKW